MSDVLAHSPPSHPHTTVYVWASWYNMPGFPTPFHLTTVSFPVGRRSWNGKGCIFLGKPTTNSMSYWGKDKRRGRGIGSVNLHESEQWFRETLLALGRLVFWPWYAVEISHGPGTSCVLQFCSIRILLFVLLLITKPRILEFQSRWKKHYLSMLQFAYLVLPCHFQAKYERASRHGGGGKKPCSYWCSN